jgi:hypothetical protein
MRISGFRPTQQVDFTGAEGLCQEWELVIEVTVPGRKRAYLLITSVIKLLFSSLPTPTAIVYDDGRQIPA